MKQDKFIIRKVPVEKFIDILVELFDMGLDYIDISHIESDNQDNIVISYSKEYMSPNVSEEAFDDLKEISDIIEPGDTDKPLTDEDINQITL